MSEDATIDHTASWPHRAAAVANRPAALSDARLQSWPVVVHTEGIDETAITLMDVQHIGDAREACLQRQQWSFDEESLRWVMDSNEEWWLPAGVARRLSGLLDAP